MAAGFNNVSVSSRCLHCVTLFYYTQISPPSSYYWTTFYPRPTLTPTSSPTLTPTPSLTPSLTLTLLMTVFASVLLQVSGVSKETEVA